MNYDGKFILIFVILSTALLASANQAIESPALSDMTEWLYNMFRAKPQEKHEKLNIKYLSFFSGPTNCEAELEHRAKLIKTFLIFWNNFYSKNSPTVQPSIHVWIKCILPVYGITAVANRELNELITFGEKLEIESIQDLFTSSAQTYLPQNRQDDIRFLIEFKKIHWINYHIGIINLINDNNRIRIAITERNFLKFLDSYESHLIHMLENMIRYFLKKNEITKKTMETISVKVETFVKSSKESRQMKDQMKIFAKYFNDSILKLNEQTKYVVEMYHQQNGQECVESFDKLVSMTADFKTKWYNFMQIVDEFMPSFSQQFYLKKAAIEEINKHFHVRI